MTLTKDIVIMITNDGANVPTCLLLLLELNINWAIEKLLYLYTYFMHQLYIIIYYIYSNLKYYILYI